MIGLKDLRSLFQPQRFCDSLLMYVGIQVTRWHHKPLLTSWGSGMQDSLCSHQNFFFSSSAACQLCLIFFFSSDHCGNETQNLPLPIIQYLPTRSQKKHLPSLATAASAGCVLGTQQAYIWQKGKEIEERERQQLVPPVLRWRRSVLQQKFLPAVNFSLKNSEKAAIFSFQEPAKEKENLHRTHHSSV